jgi:hypothetical protein
MTGEIPCTDRYLRARDRDADDEPADRPPANTLRRTTMTDVQIHYLNLTLEQTIDDENRTEWKCSEHGVKLAGTAADPLDAVREYVDAVAEVRDE